MSQTHDPIADDIQNEDDLPSRRLEAQADAILAGETQSFEPTTSLRRAVRDDYRTLRSAARDRVEGTRDAIADAPLKSALYAVGVGVLIGLLLRR